MPDNRIRIERIDKCLVLEGQAGGSVGEQLSIAYAFLSTLFNRSDQQLPFVVDSPAGAIDLATRRRISKLVPNLSRQFIAFTISAERQDFVPNLKVATNGSMQCLTLFRKGPIELEATARATCAHQESIDGILVEQEAFFNTFHLDEEVL
jgi:DNA sulfur modification protein DndD